MGLYDLAFPDPVRGFRTALLCGLIGLDPKRVPRLRDTWVELVDDGLRVAVYTRSGGPNREDHDEAIQALRGHPAYLSDRDDTFDRTYATFRFARLPSTAGRCRPRRALPFRAHFGP